MAEHEVRPRRSQFLIGKPLTVPAQAQPVNFDLLGDIGTRQPAARGRPSSELANTMRGSEVDMAALERLLRRPEVQRALQLEFIKTLTPADDGQKAIVVVAMPPERAQVLRDAYGGRLIVEEDAPLNLLPGATVPPTGDVGLVPVSRLSSGLVPLDQPLTVDLTVRGHGVHAAVRGATVYLLGSIWFDTGITGDDGRVTLTLYGETRETLRALMVKPTDAYWSYWADNPDLRPGEGQENIVLLTPLGRHESLAGFPEREVVTWGLSALKVDQAKSYNGQGVKIAVIDSGLFTDHEDLQGEIGRDFTDETDPGQTWRNDIVGHGSHVSGTIAGLRNEAGSERSGICGLAPAAEVHTFKVFPGGRFSDLIESLSRCIDSRIDVVNLSLGSEQGSELLRQKIQDARDQGVACIAAAGNSAGAVLYPARYDEVLAVAAIGKLNTFPVDSYHVQQIGAHTSGEYFTAKFTCFGDSVDLCAPGVAVVSTVPTGPRGYASWDGTSMACPHVCGLAALILQHRQDIRSLQGGERVAALFAALKDCAEPLAGVPTEYQGAGFPNAVKALGPRECQPELPSHEDPLGKLAGLLEEAIHMVKSLEIK